MGSRTYSPDRKVAARMVVATIRGYLAAGLVPAVKHFPGLGTVTGDSHHSLPVQPKPLDLLDRTDLVTFRAAVDAGAPVVMTGHVAVPSVEKGMPASLSEAVITRVLRDDLGFQGVAITDSQGMGPVFGKYGSPRARSARCSQATTWCSTRPSRCGPGARCSGRCGAAGSPRSG